MEGSTRKSMEWQWVHPWVRHWLIIFQYTLNRLKNCPSECKPYYYRRYVDDIFVLFTSPENLEAFQHFLNDPILTCHMQLEMKSKTQCLFLMYKLFVKIKKLLFLSTGNELLLELIHILRAFYHLLKSLALPDMLKLD